MIMVALDRFDEFTKTSLICTHEMGKLYMWYMLQ